MELGPTAKNSLEGGKIKSLAEKGSTYLIDDRMNINTIVMQSCSAMEI